LVTPLAHLWQSVQTGKQKSAIHLELIIDVLTGLGVWRPVSTCLNWICWSCRSLGAIQRSCSQQCGSFGLEHGLEPVVQQLCGNRGCSDRSVLMPIYTSPDHLNNSGSARTHEEANYISRNSSRLSLKWTIHGDALLLHPLPPLQQESALMLVQPICIHILSTHVHHICTA